MSISLASIVYQHSAILSGLCLCTSIVVSYLHLEYIVATQKERCWIQYVLFNSMSCRMCNDKNLLVKKLICIQRSLDEGFNWVSMCTVVGCICQKNMTLAILLIVKTFGIRIIFCNLIFILSTFKPLSCLMCLTYISSATRHDIQVEILYWLTFFYFNSLIWVCYQN